MNPLLRKEAEPSLLLVLGLPLSQLLLCHYSTIPEVISPSHSLPPLSEEAKNDKVEVLPDEVSLWW